MGYFKNAQEVYDHLGRLMSDVMADEDLGPRFRSAGTSLRQEFTDPSSVITVTLHGDDRDGVTCGEAAADGEVTMRMQADVAHRFWMGEVNVALALARGEMEAEGPIEKILKLVPLTSSTFPMYRRLLAELGGADAVPAGSPGSAQSRA